MKQKICLIGKYPPIQGGVSRQTYWLARCFATLGNEVHVVTNSDEVELDYRIYMPKAENEKLECKFDNGGFVKLYTTSETKAGHYIPYSNPFVSKLASIAFDVVTKNNCSFIYTSYLEPYGFAGALVSQWTGIPYSVQHAGSDIGRLAQIEERSSAYLNLMKNADLIIASKSSIRHLISIGIDHSKFFLNRPAYLPQNYFSSLGETLDIERLLDEISNTEFCFKHFTPAKFDPSKPTIGIYGKPGKYKGTLELLKALSQVKKRQKTFNFVAIYGNGKAINNLATEIIENDLQDRSYILPYIPHWLIPSFLRSCTAICFLENRFPVAIHQPQVPKEVLACGRCLLLSKEILNKQGNKNEFKDRENYISIPDPQDVEYLADAITWVIDNQSLAEQIGRNGLAISSVNNDPSIYLPLLDRLEEASKITRQKNMTISAFQDILSKIYTSPNFQKLLNSDENILENFDLTFEERTSLFQLVNSGGPLIKFTESLYRKKFNFLWKQFGTVKKHFEEIEESVFKLFKENYDFLARTWADEIYLFWQLLNKYFYELGSLPNIFLDVAKYDYMLRKASLYEIEGKLVNINNSIVEVPSSITDVSILENTYLLKPESVLLEEFAYDVLTLASKGDIEFAKHEKHVLAFVASSTGLTSDVHDLSPTISKIVTVSENATTLHNLLEEAARFNNIMDINEQFRVGCIQAIKQLIEKGILVFI
jgi:glycosyltransferase involved in cell wall biosynthesis